MHLEVGKELGVEAWFCCPSLRVCTKVGDPVARLNSSTSDPGKGECALGSLTRTNSSRFPPPTLQAGVLTSLQGIWYSAVPRELFPPGGGGLECPELLGFRAGSSLGS